MSEPTLPTDRADGSVCPWCSATVTPETVTCPSCKAVLTADEEPNLPGVTAIDQKVVRGEKPAQRNRLLSWISGEYPEEVPTTEDSQAIAPPEPEVQREIRRLEFEAEVANLQAEVDALQSEAVAEGRAPDLAIDDPTASAEDGIPVEGAVPAGRVEVPADGEAAADEDAPPA